MKINIKNQTKVEKAIENAQPNAKVRTIDYKDIIKSVDKLQNRLDALMLRKDQVGAVCLIDPNAQDFPGAYKWAPESTGFEVIRYPSGWFITQLIRCGCATANNQYYLKLTDSQKIAMVDFVVEFKNWPGKECDKSICMSYKIATRMANNRHCRKCEHGNQI